MRADAAQLVKSGRARSREQLSFLAEAGRVLSLSLDPATTLERIARLAVPRIADWCGVDVLQEDGEIRSLAVLHADASKTDVARELRAYPQDPDDSRGLRKVLRTGQSELYEDIPDELLVLAARDERQLYLLRQLGMKSVMIVPLIALAAGLTFYLMGGRYISTDNAYVGAQKVLITPDISGKVSRVLVKEGQHVAAGDDLFEVDPVPFQLAVRQAQSKLDSVRTDFANLKSNLKSLTTLADLAQQNVALKRADVDRKKTLLAKNTSSQLDVDTAMAAMVSAELQALFEREA